MKILIFNWKDVYHPEAGGAEQYLYEIIKRLVKEDHEVTLLTSLYIGAKREEVTFGGKLRILRKGNKFTTYLWAPFQFFHKLKIKRYDIILDSENGIPFFTPFFIRSPKICIVYHVHKEVFRKELGIISIIGYFLEDILMPIVYRKIPFITISTCTRKDLEKLGISKKHIFIVVPGINVDEKQKFNKTNWPSLLYFNRFSKYKNVEDTVYVLKKVKEKIPETRLSLGGCKGTREERKIKHLVEKLNLFDSVDFFSFVPQEKKDEIFAKHWVHILPSMKEGFGMSVIEAAKNGTPTVGYDVPGLRSTVRNGETGFLVPYRRVDLLADAVLKILQNDKLRQSMSEKGIEFSKNFDWEKTYIEFMKIIKQEISKCKR